MGLEAATYISQLVSTNPLAADGMSQGDDHLRLLKAVLQAQFPSLGAAAVSAAAADLSETTKLLTPAAATTSGIVAGTNWSVDEAYAFYKIGKYVIFHGVRMKATGAGGATIATFPAGFRPVSQVRQGAFGTTASLVADMATVDTGGAVTSVQAYALNQFFFIPNMIFVVP